MLGVLGTPAEYPTIGYPVCPAEAMAYLFAVATVMAIGTTSWYHDPFETQPDRQNRDRSLRWDARSMTKDNGMRYHEYTRRPPSPPPFS